MIDGTVIEAIHVDKYGLFFTRKTFVPYHDIRSIYLDQDQGSENYGYYIVYTSDTSYVTRTNIIPNHNLSYDKINDKNNNNNLSYTEKIIKNNTNKDTYDKINNEKRRDNHG